MYVSMNARLTLRHTHRLLLVIVLVSLAGMASASAIRQILVPADSRGPQISAQLWTPCAPSPDANSSEGKDCAALRTHLPLIVISHGMFGDMFSHHDTAEHLADAGFAVVALNHPQDWLSASRDTVDDISSFLVRPVDIKRVIDFLASNPRTAAEIDSRRTGFFGFSRGGYTGLVLAGAVPAFHAPPFPCPDEFLMCRQIRDKRIPDHDPGYEPRIKAFAIADPVSFFPDKSSLQNVTAPIQLWSSDHGGMGVRPEDVASVERNLPRTPEFYRTANSAHLSFNAPCSNESIVCTDPPGFDRSEFHRTFNARVLEFFRKHLLAQ